MSLWLLALLIVLVAVIAYLIWRWPRRVSTYGSNPNPSYITDAMWNLWQELAVLEPGTQLGGIYANKPGYHNSRKQCSPYDYSVVDPEDQRGPGDKACALDWTFPEAQRGDYERIALYTSRLLKSAKDVNDPRLNGWREFYGQSDWDSAVEGWDCRYGYAVTSDSSHLWHIHLSESREHATSWDNKEALLSVLKGQTVEQWLGTLTGDGAVLLNCPYDNTRQDLFYVSTDGTVVHRWGKGLGAFWNGQGSSENLGGTIAAGTLTAMWKPDESGLYIAGLGTGDSKAPAGSGQYWGMELSKGGGRSGWGSFEKCYGAWPSALPQTTTTKVEQDKSMLFLIVLVAIITIAAFVLALVD